MAKKSELEEQRDAYEAKMVAARDAERQGLFHRALMFAISAYENIDGMMQFRCKYEDAEFKSVSAIDLVLRYSPLLFHFESLVQLQDLLKAQKRIDKLASDDVAERVSTAIGEMWDNHRLFTFLEANPECRQDALRASLGGDQDYWRWVAEAWARMGLLNRIPERGSYRLSLATRLGQIAEGKCPACGHVDRAPKAMFLEEISCPGCARTVWFVLLGAAAKGE